LIIDQGDPAFDDLLQKLVLVRTANWALLYRHSETGELWDVTFPHGEMQGGGPQRLRRLSDRDPKKWEPYPAT